MGVLSSSLPLFLSFCLCRFLLLLLLGMGGRLKNLPPLSLWLSCFLSLLLSCSFSLFLSTSLSLFLSFSPFSLSLLLSFLLLTMLLSLSLFLDYMQAASQTFGQMHT